MTDNEQTQEEQPKRRGRKPHPANGAAITPKPRGRPRKTVAAAGKTLEIVLTKGKRASLTVPPGMSEDDLSALEAQFTAFKSLLSVQAEIEKEG